MSSWGQTSSPNMPRFPSSGILNLPFGQIKFPSTQNPSSDANTLDDYEEGTWTPVIGGSGGESGQVYSDQTGLYTKVGNLVSISARVQLSTLGIITGNVEIRGLPFSPTSIPVSWAVPINWNNFTTLIFFCQGQLFTSTSNIAIRMIITPLAGMGANVTQADLSNTTVFVFNIVYRAAA